MTTQKIGQSTLMKRGISIALTLALLLSLLTLMSAAQPSASAASEMTFKNISDSGADKISMTDIRTFEVTVPLAAGADAENLISAGLTWDLSREKGSQDPDDFPYQYLGGNLKDWTVSGSSTKLFSAFNETAVEADGAPAIKFTFRNGLLFNSTGVNGSRNRILDYIGDYTLSCTDAAGNQLGACTVRLNPYDSYRLNTEFSSELVQAAIYANGRDDMYAEIKSLGESSEGRDMPYIIIADSQETLTEYQELKQKAESDPAALQAQVRAGTLDYKVPILYSNIHADENNGADAPMNFIWDLVKSDQTDNKVPYDMLTGLTPAGEARIELERSRAGLQTSTLLEDWPTFLGAATDRSSGFNSGVVDLEKYYTIEKKNLDVEALLDEVFFIIVPEENVDGRTYNIRQNGEGFDLNRDNLFQTQVETRNMTAMIAQWNPVTFFEFHGFVGGFQVEPCSPPHEPNVEYDLFAEMALKGGEAFGAAAVANNSMYNSYVMPLRDYLETSNGKPYWRSPWDDMSGNYTPQYSMLHGTVAYTIEIPAANEQGTLAMEYGMISHAQFVMDNKDTLFLNMLEVYRRGIENIDVDSVRPWYVDANDNPGAEADIFRPRYEENNNFFPEYYVIPLDTENQRNLAAAYEMEEYFIRNGVTVSRLTADTAVKGVTYKAGSMVINMRQAKRNLANAALYQGVLIDAWPTLYSEPITAFDKTRGFDCDAIRVVGAFDGKLEALSEARKGATQYTGKPSSVVAIKNSGVEAVRAVNALLDAGKQVGYITAGDYQSDFLVSYMDFTAIRDDFVLSAYGLTVSPPARVIEKPKVYIVGKPAENTSGYKYYNQKYGNTAYNFNRFAFDNQMGFTLTDNLDDATVILANRTFRDNAERDAVLAQVRAGKPMLIAGVMSVVTTVVPGVTAVSNNGSYDALTTVEYLNESIVTDSYRLSGDNIMYSFGGNYFTALPQGATPLVRMSTDEPMEGFFSRARLDAFKGQTVAFEYIANGMDVTAFANTLTNKTHQQDDYRYVTNTIYSEMLGSEMAVPVVISAEILNPKASYAANEPFTVRVVTAPDVYKVKLCNEYSSTIGTTDQFISFNEDGNLVWDLTIKVGSKGNRTLKVWAGFTTAAYAGEAFDLPVKIVEDVSKYDPAALYSVSVVDKTSVLVNEEFTLQVKTSKGVMKLGLLNEKGAVVGMSSCASAADPSNPDQLIWTVKTKFGTKGIRTITVRAADFAGAWITTTVSAPIVVNSLPLTA